MKKIVESGTLLIIAGLLGVFFHTYLVENITTHKTQGAILNEIKDINTSIKKRATDLTESNTNLRSSIDDLNKTIKKGLIINVE